MLSLEEIKYIEKQIGKRMLAIETAYCQYVLGAGHTDGRDAEFREEFSVWSDIWFRKK